MLPINEQLQTIITKIEAESLKLIHSMEQLKMAEAEYEFEYNRVWLEEKAREKKPSVELDAIAYNTTYERHLAKIRLESECKRREIILKALRDKLEVLKEISYNERCESKLLGEK